MAQLICKDGTKVEIPDEIEQSLRDQFGKKKEFKPIVVCHLEISISYMDAGVSVLFRERNKKEDYICIQSLPKARKTIHAIQSAIDFIEGAK